MVVRREVVEHLVLRLLLGIQHFLQGEDLVDEEPVSLRNVGKQLLQLLHLLLCGRQLLGDDADMLARREVLCDLRLPRGRRFSADVVQVIFAIDAKVGMFEL